MEKENLINNNEEEEIEENEEENEINTNIKNNKENKNKNNNIFNENNILNVEKNNNKENLYQNDNENDEIFDYPKVYKLFSKLINYFYQINNISEDIYNKFEKLLNFFLYNKDDYFFIFKEIYKNLIANNNENNREITLKLLNLFLLNLKKKVFFELKKNENLSFNFFGIDLSNYNYIIYFRLVIEKDINEKIISIKEENGYIEEFFIGKKGENIQNKYYVNKDYNKYINIYFKFYSFDFLENRIHIIINDQEIIKNLKENNKIKIELNLKKSFKLSKILIITTENKFSESSILNEIYNNIINKSNIRLNNYNNDELNEEIFRINNEFEANFKENINNDYFKIGGAKSLIPILEIVYKENKLFEEISVLIFNIISNSYIDFLDAVYSHVFHCYYFFVKNKENENSKNLNQQNNFVIPFLILIYNIIIYEDMIFELINDDNFYDKKQFFVIDNDNVINEIYILLFDLISHCGKYEKTKKIVNYLLLYFNEKRSFPLSKNNNNKKVNLIDVTLDELNNLLNSFKFKIKDRNKNDINSNLCKWLCLNSSKNLNFFISNFHRYDIIYITFELCRKLINNIYDSDKVEIEIITYFLFSLKLGIVVEKKREESIFYYNSNFLIILLNYLQNLKNEKNNEQKESININFILQIIIKIVDYIKNPGILVKLFNSKDSYPKSEDLPYFNFYSRFVDKKNSIYEIEENNGIIIIGNDVNINKIKDIINIKKKINEFKFNQNNSLKKLIKYEDYLNYKLFRDLKKELFSWNSTYSNIKDFYIKKNIKFKRCFHLTRDMAIPLLEPILDYNYYKTNFSQNFQMMKIVYDYNLFFNHKYKLGNITVNNETKFCKMNKIYYHIYGIFTIEKYYFEFIGYDKIVNNLNQFEKLGLLGKFNEDTKDSLYYIKIIFHKINFILKKKYYFEDNALEIYYDNNKSYYFIFKNSSERDLIFDKISNFIDIKLSDKKEIIGKVNKNYEIDLSDISNIINLWKNCKISNFQYLMLINILSSRSYRDISQYPVFPWLLNNYTIDHNFLNIKMNIKENEEIIINELFNNYLRDLDLPIGLFEISTKGKARKKNYYTNYIEIIKNRLYSNLIQYEYIEKEKEYKIIKEIKNQEYNSEDLLNFLKNPQIKKIKCKELKYTSDKLKIENIYNDNTISLDLIPYFFGSHFSNPAYVCHYLTRIFPFSFAAVEIQGSNFGAPDRLFINLDKSFMNCTNQKSDLREIIPEFYFLPDMFINFNQLEFGYLQDRINDENATSKILKKIHNCEEGKIKVNEVLTAFWNENNPIYFVYLYRKIFEKKNLNINKWINLIFGIYSFGDNARKKGNLYSPYVYDNVIKCRLNKMDNDLKYSHIKLYELGINPKPILIKYQDLDEIIRKIDEKNYYKITINHNNNENKVINLKIPENSIIDIKLDKNDNYIFYKFIFENYQITKQSLLIDDLKIDDYQMEITSLSIYNYKKDNTLLICGTGDGTTLIYNSKPNYKKALYKIFNNHSKKINYINANDNLNMFIDCSEDDYIHLYTLPNAKLIRSIRQIGIIFVFLTSSPLIGFVAISNNKMYMYTINGQEVINIDKELTIKEPYIIHDEEFNDYLVYNLNEIIKLPLLQSYNIENGMIKIKKLNTNQNLQNQNFLFYNIKKS